MYGARGSRMKNGLGRDVNCPTRPSPYGDFAVTLPKSESEITQVIQFIWCGFGEGVAIGIFLHNEKRPRMGCQRDRFVFMVSRAKFTSSEH